ncbi:MAG: helix-turn-helix domain-containing protein [Hyphomicrobiales bacterium]
MIKNQNGAITVKDFLDWARISRTTFYKEVKEGRIPLKKVGKRSLVLRRDAEAWLDSLPDASEGSRCNG